MPGITFLRKYAGQLFPFNLDGENVSEYSVLRNYLQKYVQNGNNNAKLKKVPPKFSPDLGENDGNFFDVEFRLYTFKAYLRQNEGGAMSQPKGYVDPHYLQVAASLQKQTKERSYTLMSIQPGYKILDVGCGPGTDTIPLAQWVGSTGQVVGVDYDAAMIGEADQHAREAGVSERVKHKQADAVSLPFETGAFDACRSERLFQHLLNPVPALSEMARVTKSGGWIVVLDTDWGAALVDSSEVDIERRLARVRAERTLHNGYAGRQLYRLFKRQNLLDISIEGFVGYTTSYAVARLIGVEDNVEKEALSAGIVTMDELRRYQLTLEQADAEGVFFASNTGIMLAGRKP